MNKKKHLLITGGLGFIGSNFVEFLSKTNHDFTIIILDNNSYAADYSRIKHLVDNEIFIYEERDISSYDELGLIFNQYDIHSVIHFAAESHVDNSIEKPGIFVQTNIVGTFNLIEMCKNKWIEEDNTLKKGYEDSRFYHISTDEVYGSLEKDGFFTELSSYQPNSPYSASKASSDLLVRSFHKTYKLPTLISNCSNNFGGNQNEEKLIPTIIRKALKNEKIPIYGNGKNVRDWLFVEDHCDAIWEIFKKGNPGDQFIIGGDNEINNVDLCLYICEKLDTIYPNKENIKYAELIEYVEDRKGHDFRYAVDSTKLRNELNWFPQWKFDDAIEYTINHYLKKYI